MSLTLGLKNVYNILNPQHIGLSCLPLCCYDISQNHLIKSSTISAEVYILHNRLYASRSTNINQCFKCHCSDTLSILFCISLI